MKKQLPPRPNLEQLKKQAKAVVKGHHSGDSAVIARIREHHPDWRGATAAKVKESQFALNDAQLVIAKEYGFSSWAKLKSHVLSRKPDLSTEELAKALRDAVGSGDLTRTIELLDAYPQIIDERGGPGVRTALHFAVFGARQDAVKLLLDRGANPNIRCEGDYAYPLHFAAEKQQFGIIRLLVEHGADPVGEGDYHELGVLGWLTAWEAIKADSKIVKYLLAHGARHNVFSAVATGAVDAIREIVRKTPGEIERRMEMTNKRRYPLHLAVIKKRVESVMALLDLGANIESLDESAFTSLDQAALLGDTKISEILLSRGARIRLPAA
ncbi:MAG TPA: ankyrin repeat domain-containing protein, partial [Candidatus Acidoferrales bacterium]|nr:ankyrin repeat domain-containing protein [Candidatus Acidoferrales bacterium]